MQSCSEKSYTPYCITLTLIWKQYNLASGKYQNNDVLANFLFSLWLKNGKFATFILIYSPILERLLRLKFDQKLQSGLLIKRYKRFLADVDIVSVDAKGATPQEITIHCPNTGAMTGCNVPGSRVWFSVSNNAKRKYPNTWELLETPEGDWACINTALANRLVEEAITNGVIDDLKGYDSLAREVRYGEERSRIDILLS